MRGLTDEGSAPKLGKLSGARLLVVGNVSSLGSTFIFNVRALSIQSATVPAAGSAKVARADLADFIKDALAADPAASVDEAPPDLAGRPVEVRLRILSDRLAKGFAKLPGKGRYERIVVAQLTESGEAARDLELGTLVAAQLSTFLQRDHGFLLLERDRLADVLKEMEMGMTGLVDPAQAAKAGKLAGAQAIVVGQVAEAGADFSINVRLIAAESAQVLVAESINLPRAGMVALSDESVVLRTRSGAIFRSLIVPGWGQFYNREPIKGGVLIGLEVALAATAVALHFLGAADEDSYAASNFALKYPDLTPTELSQKATDLRDSAETFYQARNGLIYAAIGVYLYNVLDAYIFGIDGESQLGLALVPTGSADVTGALAPGFGLSTSF